MRLYEILIPVPNKNIPSTPNQKLGLNANNTTPINAIANPPNKITFDLNKFPTKKVNKNASNGPE